MKDFLFPQNENNPILYIIRYLFSFYDNENKKKNKNRNKGYSQILRITTKGNGELIMRHLLNYESCTVFELVDTYEIPYATADRIIKLLERADIVHEVGTVGRPYWNGVGKRIKIYLLDGAESICGVEAQQRYGEIVKRSVGCLNHKDLEEAVNVVKEYLVSHDTNRIPDNKTIIQLIKDKGLKGIPVVQVIRVLTKEGYRW